MLKEHRRLKETKLVVNVITVTYFTLLEASEKQGKEPKSSFVRIIKTVELG